MKKTDRNYETSDSEAETNARLRYNTPLVCRFIVFVSKNEKKNSEIEMEQRLALKKKKKKWKTTKTIQGALADTKGTKIIWKQCSR